MTMKGYKPERFNPQNLDFEEERAKKGMPVKTTGVEDAGNKTTAEIEKEKREKSKR